MKINENDPLPRHTKYDWEECYAKVVLETLVKDRVNNLKIKDKPDLQNDAINVGKFSDIPMDYDGVMGVPITFLDKYCPTQFEIVGQMMTTKITEFNFGYPYINGKKKFARLLIKRIS